MPADLQAAVAEAKLLPEPAGVGGPWVEYGFSVAMDGDLALVGSFRMAATGAAILFERSELGWQEKAILRPRDGLYQGEFGFSVSLSGDRALVGARFDDDNGESSGSAYVFEFDGQDWIQTAKLLPGNGQPNDQFGYSVSLDGDRALVGAWLSDGIAENAGSAHVFEFDGADWEESQVLEIDTGRIDDWFGYSVSLSGDRALVGSWKDIDGAENVGAAYVFDFNGSEWIRSAELGAADAEANDVFAHAVSLEGDRALIGVRADDDNGINSGSAYVYEFDGQSWIDTAKLAPLDGEAGDEFGWTVRLLGDRALISSIEMGGGTGSAYVFDFDGSNWSQASKLVAADGEAGDQFGVALGLSSNGALVGAWRADDLGEQSGSAYLFAPDGSSWTQQSELTPREGASFDYFGESVSQDGNRVIVGAVGDDGRTVFSGAAYIFENDGRQWRRTAKLTTSAVSDGPFFGRAVDIEGDRAVIGAPLEIGAAGASGAVFVFEFDGAQWNEVAKLLPTDGDPFELFGTSVALSGDRILIGAEDVDDNGRSSGSAYVFERQAGGWIEAAELLPSDGVSFALFGRDVALEGNVALVGAPGGNRELDAGVVYAFEFNAGQWGQTALLVPADGESSDNFGVAVGLEGDRAVVASIYHDPWGAAYVFSRVGISWEQTAKLTPSDSKSVSFFGSSVSLFDDQILIGAVGASVNGPFSGAAYLFGLDGTTWSERAELAPGDGLREDDFGASVSLQGERAVIGANYHDQYGYESGAVYVFDTGLLFRDGFEP